MRGARGDVGAEWMWCQRSGAERKKTNFADGENSQVRGRMSVKETRKRRRLKVIKKGKKTCCPVGGATALTAPLNSDPQLCTPSSKHHWFIFLVLKMSLKTSGWTGHTVPQARSVGTDCSKTVSEAQFSQKAMVPKIGYVCPLYGHVKLLVVNH